MKWFYQLTKAAQISLTIAFPFSGAIFLILYSYFPPPVLLFLFLAHYYLQSEFSLYIITAKRKNNVEKNKPPSIPRQETQTFMRATQISLSLLLHINAHANSRKQEIKRLFKHGFKSLIRLFFRKLKEKNSIPLPTYPHCNGKLRFFMSKKLCCNIWPTSPSTPHRPPPPIPHISIQSQSLTLKPPPTL